MSKRIFLDHDQLKYVRRLRGEGKLDQAEKMLLQAEPSPAVLDEIRKLASTRARQAKKDEDWAAVVRHLDGYNQYADKWRQYTLDTVNQEPPSHTKSDTMLLEEAKAKLAR